MAHAVRLSVAGAGAPGVGGAAEEAHGEAAAEAAAPGAEALTPHNRRVAQRTAFVGERAPYAPEASLARPAGAEGMESSAPGATADHVNAMGQLLASFSGFVAVPKCDIVQLARTARYRRIDATASPKVIFRHGSSTDTVYLVVSGTVSLAFSPAASTFPSHLDQGDQSLTFHHPNAPVANVPALWAEAGEMLTLRAGAFVNDVGAFCQTPGTANVSAIAHGGIVDIVLVPFQNFRECFRNVADGPYVTSRLVNLLSFPLEERLGRDTQAVAALLSAHEWTASLGLNLLHRLFAKALIRQCAAFEVVFEAGAHGEGEGADEEVDSHRLDEMYAVISGSLVLYAPENMVGAMASARAKLIANTCSSVQQTTLSNAFERLSEEESREEAEKKEANVEEEAAAGAVETEAGDRKKASAIAAFGKAKDDADSAKQTAEEADAKNALSVSRAAGRFMRRRANGTKLRRGSVMGQFAVDAMESLAESKRSTYLTTLNVGTVVGEGTALAQSNEKNQKPRERTTTAKAGHHGVTLMVLNGLDVKEIGKVALEKMKRSLSALASHRLLTSLLIKPVDRRPHQHNELIKALTSNCSFLTEDMGEVHGSLCAVSGLRTFKRGEPCVLQGEQGDAFYLILEGKCTVHKMDIDSREAAAKMEAMRRHFAKVRADKEKSTDEETKFAWSRAGEHFEDPVSMFGPVVMELHAHQYFGELALLDRSDSGGQRRASVIASSANVTLMAIGRAEYLAIIAARQRRMLVDRCADLRLLPPISKWSDVRLARLAYSFTHRTFPMQAVLCTQGHDASELHIIISGACRASRRAPASRSQRSDPMAQRVHSVGLVAGVQSRNPTSRTSHGRASSDATGGSEMVRYDLSLLGPGSLVGDYVTFVARNGREPFDVVSCDDTRTLSVNGAEFVRILEQEDRRALASLEKIAKEKWDRELDHEKFVMNTFGAALVQDEQAAPAAASLEASAA